MTELIDDFKAFMADPDAPEMYIQGVAGTGKTTYLGELLLYCQVMRYVSVTCAYTHKAVGVLASKLPPMTTTHLICTLHSYLKKRPTINDKATKVSHVEGNTQLDIPDVVDVIFVDEFSMIGESDYVDLMALQYDEDGKLILKIVYIGDRNQLPPVKDQQTIVPNGKYVHTLTKIYRQADGNKLIDTLLDLNDYINGKPAEPLVEHENFKRGCDIIKSYKDCSTSKILLAYTNACVETLNREIQGYKVPVNSDNLFSPTLRKHMNLGAVLKRTDHITTIMGEMLELDSKYKTLETLHKIKGIQFYDVAHSEGDEHCYAAIFGHETYKTVSNDLALAAVKLNKQIVHLHGVEAKIWAKANWQKPLAKDRAKAWRNYLAFKTNVICLDFPHAMTVHKSQGSTYDNVFIDFADISKCADNDYSLYLKLLYVAISRASNTVYTN